MCIEFDDGFLNNIPDKISKLYFANTKPTIPGRYYASKNGIQKIDMKLLKLILQICQIYEMKCVN